jgi:type VI secretion system secreted protein Hcp
MAHDIFLKLDGIKGESQDATHKDEIEVISWNWAVSQTSTMHSGSGGGSSKATVSDLSITHWMDCASPNLMKYALTGKHVPSAVLVVRKAGGNPLEFLKFTMTDVIITNVRPSGDNGESGRPKEQVSLSFSKVKQEYVTQNAQGGSGGTISAAYDIKANVEM